MYDVSSLYWTRSPMVKSTFWLQCMFFWSFGLTDIECEIFVFSANLKMRKLVLFSCVIGIKWFLFSLCTVNRNSWTSVIWFQQQQEMVKRLFLYFIMLLSIYSFSYWGNLTLSLTVVFRNKYGVSFWFTTSAMSQCLEGIKHLCTSLLSCCDLELTKQSQGLDDPAILASQTVCMQLVLPYYAISVLITLRVNTCIIL